MADHEDLVVSIEPLTSVSDRADTDQSDNDGNDKLDRG